MVTLAGRCVLVLGALAAAAGAQPSDGLYTLSGSVLNSHTGQPVSRAQVTVWRLEISKPDLDGFTTGEPFTTSILADTAGTFRFDGLTGGHYMLSAYKPGFLPNSTSGRQQIELSASADHVQVKLSPLGVITGKVADQEGQPLRGVNVMALSVSLNDGLATTSVNSTVNTDDRGIYRIWNLPPGKYFIKAAGRVGGTYLYVGDRGPVYDAAESFAPVYSGGARKLEAAQPTLIEPGTEAQADLRVSLEPSYKIRGSLANFTPHHAVRFELLSGDEDVVSSRVSVNGATGVFEIQDVLSGDYTLRATDGTKARGEVAVTVRGADLSGVTVTLAPAVDIKVVVRTTNGVKTAGRSDVTGDLQVQFRCGASLIPAGRRPGQRYVEQHTNGEEMTIAGVLPGQYRVCLQCSGGYPTSVMAGSQDLLSNPLLTVQPGVAPLPIEVIGRTGGGTLTGTLHVGRASGESQPGFPFRAGVLLVPQFGNSTGPQTVPVFQLLQPDAGEYRFSLHSLAPGDYLVFGFSKINEVEYRNPDFLRSLTGGVSASIADNSEQTVAIPGVVQ
jgi:Carboxypeptidase regulatory-like domain